MLSGKLTSLNQVLILVLLELAFGEQKKGVRSMLRNFVLILVLLELAFGELREMLKDLINNCLNPCFTGTCFRRFNVLVLVRV